MFALCEVDAITAVMFHAKIVVSTRSELRKRLPRSFFSEANPPARARSSNSQGEIPALRAGYILASPVVLRFPMTATGFGSSFIPLKEVPHRRRIPLSSSCSTNASRVQYVRDRPEGLHAIFLYFTNYQEHIG
jgi:hypothetical protein